MAEENVIWGSVIRGSALKRQSGTFNEELELCDEDC